MKFFKKKIGLLDFSLILFVLLMVGVFAVVFFRKSTHIIVTIRVGEDSTFYSPWMTDSFYWNDTSGSKDWFVRFFEVGLKEKDGLGNIQAEVLKIQTYDKTPTKKVVYLTTKLRVVYSKASGGYTYKGIPVLVGSKVKLNLGKVLVEGLITDSEGYLSQIVRKKLVVEAQLREENPTFLETSGVKSYLADAIKTGDVVEDNRGNDIVKILDKKVLPAQKTTVSSDGKPHLETDPVRKDVFLTLEIEAFQLGDKFFFLDDIPVLVDSIIPINTKTYSIFPVVTKFISTK